MFITDNLIKFGGANMICFLSTIVTFSFLHRPSLLFKLAEIIWHCFYIFRLESKMFLTHDWDFEGFVVVVVF